MHAYLVQIIITGFCWSSIAAPTHHQPINRIACAMRCTTGGAGHAHHGLWIFVITILWDMVLAMRPLTSHRRINATLFTLSRRYCNTVACQFICWELWGIQTVWLTDLKTFDLETIDINYQMVWVDDCVLGPALVALTRPCTQVELRRYIHSESSCILHAASVHKLYEYQATAAMCSVRQLTGAICPSIRGCTANNWKSLSHIITGRHSVHACCWWCSHLLSNNFRLHNSAWMPLYGIFSNTVHLHNATMVHKISAAASIHGSPKVQWTNMQRYSRKWLYKVLIHCNHVQRCCSSQQCT